MDVTSITSFIWKLNRLFSLNNNRQPRCKNLEFDNKHDLFVNFFCGVENILEFENISVENKYLTDIPPAFSSV